MEEEIKLKVKNLYKLFQGDVSRALNMVKEGYSNEEIKQQTGSVTALRDINFEVGKGEIFVIMGLSGSGKSTLLRCVNRLIEPSEGEVHVEDQEITKLNKEEIREARRHIFGTVFQEFALFPHRNVLSNVTFGLEIQNFPKEERREKGKEVIKTVGLKGWENSDVARLSGGMRQRVGLARALAVDPEILLMDEPFSALDPLIKTNMQDELLRLQERVKKTVLFITHDLNEAIKMGDRIAILNSEGKMIQTGNPEEILLRPATDYVKKFVGNVDRPAAIRTETVMKETSLYVLETQSESQVKEKMEKNNLDYAFVVKESQKLSGLVFKKDLEETKEEVKNKIKEVKAGSLFDPIKNIMAELLEYKIPVPVVDKENRLVGEVSKPHVLKILR